MHVKTERKGTGVLLPAYTYTPFSSGTFNSKLCSPEPRNVCFWKWTARDVYIRVCTWMSSNDAQQQLCELYIFFRKIPSSSRGHANTATFMASTIRKRESIKINIGLSETEKKQIYFSPLYTRLSTALNPSQYIYTLGQSSRL